MKEFNAVINARWYCISQCYNCQNKGPVSGSAHSSCTAYIDIYRKNNINPLESFKLLNRSNDIPIGDKHGIENGWFMFPYNYDPVWMRSECKLYKAK
jgi:hypothetical protein